jgi:hypothetical protein
VWKGLTSIDRVNYQSIATGITLEWQTYKIPANESYSNELNATNLRGITVMKYILLKLCSY